MNFLINAVVTWTRQMWMWTCARFNISVSVVVENVHSYLYKLFERTTVFGIWGFGLSKTQMRLSKKGETWLPKYEIGFLITFSMCKRFGRLDYDTLLMWYTRFSCSYDIDTQLKLIYFLSTIIYMENVPTINDGSNCLSIYSDRNFPLKFRTEEIMDQLKNNMTIFHTRNSDHGMWFLVRTCAVFNYYLKKHYVMMLIKSGVEELGRNNRHFKQQLICWNHLFG